MLENTTKTGKSRMKEKGCKKSISRVFLCHTKKRNTKRVKAMGLILQKLIQKPSCLNRENLILKSLVFYFPFFGKKPLSNWGRKLLKILGERPFEISI